MTRTLALALARAAAAAAAIAACGGKIPQTRYYQLAAPAAAPVAAAGATPRGALVLAIEPLSADDAYQDERIVYRTGPVRLDYYEYHRWSAPPGVLIARYLEQALERTGHFRAVVRELSADAHVVLGGRVIAIEEVDESPTRWLGRVAIELRLEDARTGAVLWTGELAETEPLAEQSPEGLARALSGAMARIVARAIPEIVAATAPATAATRAAGRRRDGADRRRRRPRDRRGRARAHLVAHDRRHDVAARRPKPPPVPLELVLTGDGAAATFAP
jgi:ABC-type uncharacterized transport system auxiliary subunit